MGRGRFPRPSSPFPAFLCTRGLGHSSDDALEGEAIFPIHTDLLRRQVGIVGSGRDSRSRYDSRRRSGRRIDHHLEHRVRNLAGLERFQSLRARSELPTASEQRVDALAAKLEEELGDSVFSTHGESLEQIVAYLLEMRGATISSFC